MKDRKTCKCMGCDRLGVECNLVSGMIGRIEVLLRLCDRCLPNPIAQAEALARLGMVAR